MIKLMLLLNTFTLPLAWPITWEIIQPCKNEIMVEGNTIIEKSLPSVGSFTIERLNEKKIDYLGNENGLISLNKTPWGEAAMDVVSDNEMYIYGWCYQVNEVNPELMPADYFFQNKNDHLRWIFSFSHYLNGDWVSMCVPAYERPLQSFCQNSNSR